MSGRTFVDGRVWVRRARCATCVFRPGNLMRLEPGRLEGMIADADREGSCIPCHSHLERGERIEPVCRGYWDRKSSSTLRLAEAMEVVSWV